MITYTTKKEPFEIDEIDLPLLSSALIIFISSTGYVTVKLEQGYFLLHRLLTECPAHLYVDHKNRDKLDNRRENLRICTQAQNSRNSSKKITNRNTSQYKGVSLHTETGKWRCQIMLDYERKHIGLFETEIQAAEAYDDAAAFYFKEFAQLNFPERVPNGVEPKLREQHSKVRGVSFDKTRNKWTACIRGKDMKRWTERFNTEDEAVAALKAKRESLGI